MSKRFENKKLFYILGILLIILAVTFIVKIPREKSTLKTTLVRFDTTEVERIIIIPKASAGEKFEFFRDNKTWKVKQGEIISKPRDGAVENILSDLLSIKPSNLVSVSKSKWQDYDLTDSLAIRVRVENKKGKALADVMIGRFSYKPVSNPYGGGYGGSIDGISYVRLYTEEPVYAVDGFLTFSFSGDFDDWRDKTLIRCKGDDITKITFTFPADSGFVLEKKENKWYASGEPADSAATASYINTITYTDGEKFIESFRPVSSPVCQTLIEGNNLLNITVKCYSDENGRIILNSSLNPEAFFIDENKNVFNQIFKPLSHFKNKK